MDRTMCNQPVPLLRGGAVIFIHGFSLIAADCRRVQRKIGVVTQSQLDKHQSLHLCVIGRKNMRGIIKTYQDAT